MNENLFAHLPRALPQELTEVLVDSSSARIERIVSTGHSSPDDFWYDQDEHEWVIVLKGEAKLVFADDPSVVKLNVGDHVQIAAHRKHRVDWTSSEEPTVWLAVFYRDD